MIIHFFLRNENIKFYHEPLVISVQSFTKSMELITILSVVFFFLFLFFSLDIGLPLSILV